MRAPEFWRHRGLAAALLAPASWVYGTAVRMRLAGTRPPPTPIPVICVGNLVAGGAGKTPVALSLGQRLAASGLEVGFVTRGYGGAAAGPLAVDPARHPVSEVGDEALLLARRRPTWMAHDRDAGVRAAAAAGMQAGILDDGYQNPRVGKDISLLVVDGTFGFGNGWLMPAGPLREPVGSGLARADAVVVMGADGAGVVSLIRRLRRRLPVLRAHVRPGDAAARLTGRAVAAFAGIGLPEKFFGTLRDMGCDVRLARAFPDHHAYTAAEIERLWDDARDVDAVLVTTEKDAVRLPADTAKGIEVLTITIDWEDEAALDAVLLRARQRP